MSPAFAVLVLGAASMHALWNMIAKRLPNQLQAFGFINATVSVMGFVALTVVGFPARSALVFLFISVLVHCLYNTVLLNSYSSGDLSQAYPIARGLAPPLVALGAYIFLGQRLDLIQIFGVAVVVAGLSVTVIAPMPSLSSNRRSIGFAVATGVSIAAYSVIDGIGVRHTANPLSYAALLFILEGGIVAIAAWSIDRRSSSHSSNRERLEGVGAGVLSFGSYAIVLFAQQRNTLAAVSALRESSVVIAALLGTLVLKEGARRRRIAGACVVMCGIVALVLH
ncbi:MAG: EamA family transporter [Ferrimicrobium sp.]